MPGFLADSGTLSYNGVTFPNAINVRVQTQYIRDSAGRHIKYVRHSLTVETVFHVPDASMGTPPNEAAVTTTSGTLDAIPGGFPRIRKLLSQSGGKLVYTGHGFGEDFKIDTTIQSVSFGPHPEVLSWEQLGSSASARCVWTVSVQIPEPVSQSPHPLNIRLVEMNYAMSYDITESGLTRRLAQGSMELATRRIGGAYHWGGTRSVDAFRNYFQVKIPNGFTRVSQNWSLSPDHRSLSFSIVDQESPSDQPYFPGTVRPRMSHSLRSGNMSFQKWISTISGSIEVAPGYPRWFAWAAFLIILKKRMEADSNARLDQTSECPDPKPGIQIVQDISIDEEIFGRTTSFSVAYMLTTDLGSLFKATGLWTVEDESITWEGYRSSMETTGAWGPRGYAQMTHNSSDDAIVAFEGRQQIKVEEQVGRGGVYGDSGHAILDQPCPSEAKSWLVFENEIELVEDSHFVHHKTLNEPEQLNLQTPSPGDSGAFNQSGQTTPPISYRRTDTTYMVVMRGYAMRICYEVPKMHLEKYGGKDVKPIGNPYTETSASGATRSFKHYQTHRKLTTLHHPVYISRWEKTYIVEGTPTETDSHGNITNDCFGAK